MNRLSFIIRLGLLSSIIIGVYAFKTTVISTQSKSCHCSKPIKLISNNVKWGESIRVVGNGTYLTTGDCSATLLTGWLKRNASNEWDTIERIEDRGVLTCGLDQARWCSDTLELATMNFTFNLGLSVENPSGIYKFTYYIRSFNRFKIRASETIEIHL